MIMKKIHSTRFAVIHDGTIKTGREFYELMKQPIWPDRIFSEVIPELITPVKQLWGVTEAGTHGWITNPSYQEEKDMRRSQIEQFVIDMQAPYPQVQIILQGWNRRDGWFIIDDPDSPQWEGVLMMIAKLDPDRKLRKIAKI